MAVFYNDLIATQVAAGGVFESLFATGRETRKVLAIVSKTATQTAGTVYICATQIPNTAILVNAKVSTPAIAGCNDVDFGIYTADGSVEKDKDAYLDGGTFSAALTASSLISTLSLANRTKTVGELAGDTTGNYPRGGYALALTLVDGGANTGTFLVEMELADKMV